MGDDALPVIAEPVSDPDDGGLVDLEPGPVPDDAGPVDLAPPPPVPAPTEAQLRRAVGAVVAASAGDALGAGYVGSGPLGPTAPVTMIASSGEEPGEWSGATELATPVLEVLARGGDVLDSREQDTIVMSWLDVLHGGQPLDPATTAVLRLVSEQLERSPGLPAAQCARRNARRRHERERGPVTSACIVPAAAAALGFLGPEDAPRLTRAVKMLVTTLHGSPEALAPAMLWAHSVRSVILDGPAPLDDSLTHVPGHLRRRWEDHVAEAASASPTLFENDGLAVEAVQVAWAAIVSTANDRGGTHLERALVAAVRAGGDTATTGWVTGALAGAHYGASALPDDWGDLIHGRLGRSGADLARLAKQAVLASHERAVSRLAGLDQAEAEGGEAG
ncbi:ADP-ribosylglycohydrolase [Flavimobilis soli]|uniref:ADP-ribosylglycohydrolase n=1 Tax=Flavimobilis soli TaxID=442709 RepID=A0A2A9EAT9_9MICO|nr:ADP-ribosylglycohydrolase [Flavimobilis soli]